jgi:hypothetical protein
MTMSTVTGRQGDHLGDETRSLVRALLLASILEHRTGSHPVADDLVVVALRALARLHTEAFGTCDACGSEIALDVLLVEPHAQCCSRCSTAAATEHSRWHWWRAKHQRNL